MTFDELWRADLALERAFVESVDEVQEVALFDDTGSSDFPPDDPDEGEVNRFLEWLEESLLLGDSSGGFTSCKKLGSGEIWDLKRKLLTWMELGFEWTHAAMKSRVTNRWTMVELIAA